MDRIRLGRIGEATAGEALLRAGYRVIERNFRCRLGEIDLIAEQDGSVVFIEVKTRTSMEFGGPGEAITPRKQRRLLRLAAFYLKGRYWLNRPSRFDTILITVRPDGTAAVELLVNAFQVDS